MTISMNSKNKTPKVIGVGTYNGWPAISEIRDFVRNRISELIYLRTTDAVTPFIRMTPGFSAVGNNMEDKKPILSSVLTTHNKKSSEIKFDDIYRMRISPELKTTEDVIFNSDFDFRPIPGIKSLDCEFRGKFGTTRKVTVQWSCNHIKDLEFLTPYFLTPGHTAFVEWGWDDPIHTNIGNIPKVSDVQLHEYPKNINKWIEESNGTYDAITGIITSYNFAANKDGGFDCTTEITSAGILMEGVQATDDKSVVSVKTDSDKEKTERFKGLKEFFENGFYPFLSDYLNTTFDSSTDCDYCVAVASDSISKYIDIKDGKADKSVLSDYSVTNPIFISWGFIEDYILNPNYSMKSKGYASSSQSHDLLSYNSVGSKIASHDGLRSIDLDICLIPIMNDGEILTDYVKSVNDQQDKKDIAIDDASQLSKFLFSESHEKYGYVRRILLNAEFFRAQMVNGTLLHDTIINIFSQISKACGNMWEFDISFNEHREINNKQNDKAVNSSFTNYIMDSKFTEKAISASADTLDTYVFNIFSTDIVNDKNVVIERVAGGIIKNYGISTKFSTAAALNVFYSAQRGDKHSKGYPQNDTTYALYKPSKTEFVNAKDTFSNAPYYSNNIAKTSDKTMQDQMFEDGNTLILKHKNYPQFFRRFLPAYSHGYRKSVKSVNSNVDIQISGETGMRMIINTSSTPNTPPSSNSIIIPVTCELEIFGLSGLRVGDSFRVDYIPENYKRNGLFHINGITHSVGKSDWTTKIKGIFRVMPMSDIEWSIYTKGEKVQYKPQISEQRKTVSNNRKTTETTTKYNVSTPKKNHYGHLAHKLSSSDIASIGKYNVDTFNTSVYYEAEYDVDNGGPTLFGISSNANKAKYEEVFALWNEQEGSGQIPALKVVYKYYYDSFFKLMGCENINYEPLRKQIYDISINFGPGSISRGNGANGIINETIGKVRGKKLQKGESVSTVLNSLDGKTVNNKMVEVRLSHHNKTRDPGAVRRSNSFLVK